MKNKLLLLTALALTLSGCTLLGTRPTSGGTEPGGTVPEAPPVQLVPDRGPVPTVTASTHIIVGLCPATGQYVALGVDTQARKFTILLSGSDTTRQQAFQQFYGVGIPVTVYTGVTALRTSTSEGTLAFDPCLGLDSGATRTSASQGPVAQAVEDPPPTPRPTGGGVTNLDAFRTLSWRTAFSLEVISAPKAATF